MIEKKLKERIEKYKTEIDRARKSGYVFAMKYEKKKEIYDIYYEIHQRFNATTPPPCWSCYKTIYKWLMYIGEYYYKHTTPKRNRTKTENKEDK